MQIYPLNPINLISPIADIPTVTPASSVGARNQTDTTQTGTNTGQAAIFIKARTGEIKLNFPSENAADADELLRTLAEAVGKANLTLNFSRDEETGAIVVKLVDQTSGETVKQIPDEALLHLSAALGKLQGRLFDQKA